MKTADFCQRLASQPPLPRPADGPHWHYTSIAALDGLIRTGKLASTPRAGQKDGAVKYGLPEVVKAYMNPPLPKAE
jgi:hypothetical protein